MAVPPLLAAATAAAASTRRLNLGVGNCAAGRIADVLAAGSLLSGSEVSEDRLDVVVEPGRVLFSHGADFSDESGQTAASSWSGSISSLGVQMMGDSKPDRRHTRSIRERMAAFAMCRKFQVTKIVGRRA